MLQGIKRISYVGLALVVSIGVANAGLLSHAFADMVPDSCFTFDAGTGTITDYDPSSDPSCLKNVTIPSTIGGVTVIAIGDGAFVSKGLTGVTIPTTVQVLGVAAFNSNNLSNITIPDSILSIGSGAFAGNQLTTVVIPDSVTTLENAFFSNPLQSISIGSEAYQGTPHIILDSGFLSGVPTLTSIKIGNTVASIDQGSFSNDTAVNSLNLGHSVTNIANGAFCGLGYDNSSPFNLTLPASLTTLGAGAFCSANITSVTIEGNATFPYAFQNVNATTGQYLNVFTSDPSNPNGFTDNTTDPSGSVWIVNPASVVVKYVDSHGNDVAPGFTKTGDTLTDYTITANPTADFSLYYRAGKVMNLDAPAVPGYPALASQTLSLKPGVNTVTFTYYTAAELAAMAPQTPDTGLAFVSHDLPIVGGLGVVTAGIVVAIVVRKRTYAKNCL